MKNLPNKNMQTKTIKHLIQIYHNPKKHIYNLPEKRMKTYSKTVNKKIKAYTKTDKQNYRNVKTKINK